MLSDQRRKLHRENSVKLTEENSVRTHRCKRLLMSAAEKQIILKASACWL